MSSFESQTLRNLPSEIWGPCGSSWKCAACGQPLWSPLGFMLVTAQALTSWLTCSEMGYLDKSGSGTKTVYNLSLEKNEKYTWFFRFRGTQPSSKNISVQNPLAPPKKNIHSFSTAIALSCGIWKWLYIFKKSQSRQEYTLWNPSPESTSDWPGVFVHSFPKMTV